MLAKAKQFDQYQGQAVTAFHLENDHGVNATILSQGGLVYELNIPDGIGGKQNILLSYPQTADFYANPFYVNMLIGPVAGRIKDATFEVDGKTVNVSANEGPNSLHSGADGFSTVNWAGTTAFNETEATVTLTHDFEGGEGHFPAMSVSVRYSLDNNDNFTVTYTATAGNQATVFNPTHHLYFNLNGDETIRDQVLQLNSTRHLDVDSAKLPTGKFLDNADTPFDFSKPTRLGDAIAGMESTPENGFDDIFEVTPGKDNQIAELSDPDNNRSVTIHSSRNGLVVFTANSFTEDMNLTIGDGHPYEGVALEAQNLSDATRFDNFGDVTLAAGETKSYTNQYQLHF